MDDGQHRRLTTWWLAIDLADAVYKLLDALPRGHADMRSQATRAADSIARHIAEGANRISPADKANRFRIALAPMLHEPAPRPSCPGSPARRCRLSVVL